MQEDQKRNWANEGYAKFGEILRHSSGDFNEYCYSIINNLVKYLGANQGGIFVASEDAYEQVLELKACYAYDRKKFVEKRIEAGEGLAGACFLEKETILLTNVPKNYAHITSGMGGQTPSCVIMVPLKTDQVVCGVIEIASFDIIEPHQVQFIEKIAESIASSISSTRVNIRTSYLLEQSKQQAEEMRAQEEEMRQNNEELLATQEEISRHNQEMQRHQKSMQEKEEKLRIAAKELELVEQKLRGNIERLKKEAPVPMPSMVMN
jgi:transcriptional regulator with GAF, ATPase, and Fis domain